MYLKNIFLLVFCIYTNLSYAQVKINNEGHIEVISAPNQSELLQLENSKYSTGLKILNSYDTTHAYGIYNNLIGTHDEVLIGNYTNIENQAVGSNAKTEGYTSFIENYGDGLTIGFKSRIKVRGLGDRYGYQVSIVDQAQLGNTYGINSVIDHKSQDRTIGMYNEIKNSGNGERIGFQNLIKEGAQSTGQRYGLKNTIQANTTETVWGSYYNIRNSIIGGTNPIYGTYIKVESNDTSITKYGIYSEASGESSYAGYFDGNLAVINGSFPMASDIRLKNSILNISNAIEIVKSLQPKSYFLNIESYLGDAQKKHYGFIA